jgi:hypothetical protein
MLGVLLPQRSERASSHLNRLHPNICFDGPKRSSCPWTVDELGCGCPRERLCKQHALIGNALTSSINIFVVFFQCMILNHKAIGFQMVVFVILIRNFAILDASRDSVPNWNNISPLPLLVLGDSTCWVELSVLNGKLPSNHQQTRQHCSELYQHTHHIIGHSLLSLLVVTDAGGLGPLAAGLRKVEADVTTDARFHVDTPRHTRLAALRSPSGSYNPGHAR